MKILHLNSDKKWVPVKNQSYDDEAHLQDLLTNDIDVLPLEEIGYGTRFVTIGKEVSLKNGSLDILAVSAQGHIALIETKLDKNPEVKRTVVGQILGYAAYLWNKSYDDLEANCFRKFIAQRKINFSGGLFDYMKEKLGEDVSEAEFKEGIEKRLRLGSFTLLIVVDQANQELKDIANYLNDRTGQEIDFYVVEMKLVGDNQENFLIPALANPPRKNITFSTEKSKANDSYDRTPITPEAFFARLSESGSALAKNLLSLENESGIKIAWRKNGFSLMTELPKDTIVLGITNNLPYLFFKTGDETNLESDELQFGYCDWQFENVQALKPIVQEYVELYRSLAGYDNKRKAINSLSVFEGDTTTKLIHLIKDINKKISSKK